MSRRLQTHARESGPRLPSALLDLACVARNDIQTLSELQRGSESLRGYCSVSARHYRALARRRGYSLEYVVGEIRNVGFFGYHCWNLYQGEIVDLTATQYGPYQPSVKIVPESDPMYYELKRGSAALKATRRWDVRENYLHQKPLLDIICARRDERRLRSFEGPPCLTPLAPL